MKYIFFLLVFFSFSFSSTLTLFNSNETNALEHIYILEDKKNKKSIDEVLRSTSWIQNKEDKNTFGYITSAYF
jgi:hypothetical protein